MVSSGQEKWERALYLFTSDTRNFSWKNSVSGTHDDGRAGTTPLLALRRSTPMY